MNSYKKILKLESELRESKASISRSEASLPRIEQEMEAHFTSLIDKPSTGQKVLLSRKKKSFQERLQKERDNIATSGRQLLLFRRGS